ncbi:LapA family protein [Anabaena sp. FACHB-1237]|uniref:LapA family protein n=1 Tax=Anabaena sp. FACHB-1237 TaxID=2692769 RepID=UPI0016814F9C|nr:LapA family protein [Anabaena sp. FACHB-1237]MBD2137247.1 LapA family protein [Anabaena sp. FACHB-1237]
MKILLNLLISLILAGWMLAIAVISVQNATPVSLHFLAFQSIQIPMGLVLALCVSLGLIIVPILQPLWTLAASSRVDEEAEFFVDDQDF